MLDEIRISAGKLDNDISYTSFPSTLLSTDNSTFEKYLKSRSQAISSAISQIFAQHTRSTPDVSEYQERITQLLALEKKHVAELEKSRLESEQMEERLETASIRYMMAEKKLDRAKSLTVAKLERQAIAGGRSDGGGGADGLGSNKNDGPNGQADNNESLAEAEIARKEALTACAKQQEQLEQLSADNEKLTSQVAALSSRLLHLTDDDYARTDLFKLIKSQHEDVIKRVNDLTAENIELRTEAEKLQAERTAYKVQLDTEAQTTISEKELQLTKAENDLARIRAARDELHADVQTRKAAQDQERASVVQIKQLVAAKDERIKALESEIERLRIQIGHSNKTTVQPDVEQLPLEELRAKYTNIERQYTMLNQELVSMGTAFSKVSSAASQKVNNLSELEEKVMRLIAEKSKADQKFFAAMKAKEAREQEVRTLRAQNSKSSDMVSQLKDAEASERAALVNHEKQLAEMKEALSATIKQQRILQQQITEKAIREDGLKAQVDDLRAALVTKDTAFSAAATNARKAEVELEQSKARLEETKKSLDMWKTKGLGNQSGEYEMLRVCSVISPLLVRY